MHIHLPKPLHGWREFIGEVAIIVIGVLIALAGEQAVEAFHHHYEVKDLEHALDQEVAWNFARMKETVDQFPCMNRRLDEIARWQRSQASGHRLKLRGEMGPPAAHIFRTAVWRSATGSTTDLIPLGRRIAYAQFYDGVDNNGRIRSAAQTDFEELSLLAGGNGLNADQQMRVTQDLTRIRTRYRAMASNYQFWLDVYPAALHVHPDNSPLPAAEGLRVAKARAAFCEPIVGS